MNKVHIITLPRLRRAVSAVQRELEQLGLWDRKMASVAVNLVPFGGPFGWQEYGGSGDIFIPAVSLCRIGDIFQRRYTALADVVRHEYAHAFADTHRRIMHRPRFEKAFWALHSDDLAVQFDSSIHVSSYAAVSAGEDFAEVWMHYCKHLGRLPCKFDTAAICAKWAFVEWLGRR